MNAEVEVETVEASEYRPSRLDRIGVYIFMMAGVAIIGWSLVAFVTRIYSLLMGEKFSAAVHLVDTTAQVPINGTTQTIPMEIDRAYVTASQLTPTAFWAATFAAVLGFLAVVLIVTCLLLLTRNILRGRVFSRTNTRLIIVAGVATLLGFGFMPILEGLVGFEIAYELSGGTFMQSALFVAEPLPFVLLGFVFAIIATAFTVGERMRRETEGLV